MAALLCDVKEGDEVIMPSFTFVSTANAFALRGAKIIFIDIDPNTMNMDQGLIKQALTEKTKVIVPVHYAGVSVDMDKIQRIAEENNLYVVEDAAQALMGKYRDKYLGSIGDIGCYSFHETKNYTSGGEGGAISINNKKLIERAEIIYEKGTNRNRFFRGEVDKYTWIDLGSSYTMADTNAAYLLYQMENREKIKNKRIKLWNCYYENLKELLDKNYIELPFIPDYAEHNGHIFYIKVKNAEERDKLIDYMFQNNIKSVFHYVPLHTSKAGVRFGEFRGEDRYTTKESSRLLRLPMYYDLDIREVCYISNTIKEFYSC
jgi:dTDP-4-amino-4,6-dideoxygalactose transaminase